MFPVDREGPSDGVSDSQSTRGTGRLNLPPIEIRAPGEKNPCLFLESKRLSRFADTMLPRTYLLATHSRVRDTRNSTCSGCRG